MTSSNPKSIAFLGASTGIGLAALKNALSTSTYTCTALCRTPSKLTSIFPTSTTPNLHIIQGNAHDLNAVTQTLLSGPQNTPVDSIVTSIGGAFVAAKFTIDDPEVCRKGMATLLEAITNIRKTHPDFKPHIICVSTTGISHHERDLPLLMIPVYNILAKVPHIDKKIMEQSLWDSGETFTVVRASFLTDGKESKPVRVGIEDPKKGREVKEIGYTISRDDAGKWIAENLVVGGSEKSGRYLGKNVSITH